MCVYGCVCFSCEANLRFLGRMVAVMMEVVILRLFGSSDYNEPLLIFCSSDIIRHGAVCNIYYTIMI